MTWIGVARKVGFLIDSVFVKNVNGGGGIASPWQSSTLQEAAPDGRRVTNFDIKMNQLLRAAERWCVVN